MSTKPDVFKVPEDKIQIVRDLSARVLALSEEKLALDQNYMATVQRIQNDIIELRRESAIKLCEAVGIPYDPEAMYAIETAYLSLDAAFLMSLKESDVIGDALSAEQKIITPPKSQLN